VGHPRAGTELHPKARNPRLRLRLQGIQSYTTTRKKALPGISHAHCPQTLIPHMPVPPQESAPSLSPRQSFGCQSPLPWVTGTDRTGSLRALWQLQGSFQEFSSPSAHSLTWRSRSQANKPYAVQYCVVTTTHGKHRPRLPKTVQQSPDDLTDMISEQRLHAQANSAFPEQPRILPLESNTGFLFRECAHGISQRQTQTPRSLDGGVHGFFRTNTGFTAFRDEPGYSGRGRTGSTLRGSGQNGEAVPSHGSSRRLYLHAPGLTLVTLGTACVPQRASPCTFPPLPGT
jgi:hypothetical protein